MGGLVSGFSSFDHAARRASNGSHSGTSSAGASRGGVPKTSTSTNNVHIPFRNSSLTSLLRAALASACRPVLIACVSPESQFAGETASTCRFAARCALVDARTVPLDGGGGASSGGDRRGGHEPRDAAQRVAVLEERVHVLERALAAVGLDPGAGAGGA